MKNFMVKLLSTSCFVGYMPVFPGTTTTFVYTILIFFIFVSFKSSYFFIIPGLALIFSVIGIPISTAAEKIFQKKDPGKVTIDEVAGIFIAFSFLRLEKVKYIGLLFLGTFAIFRALDMAKPWFINSVQRLDGGTGIMLDDIIAGVMTNVLIRLGYLISFGEVI